MYANKRKQNFLEEPVCYQDFAIGKFKETLMQIRRILVSVKRTELLSSFKNYVCIQSPQRADKPIVL